MKSSWGSAINNTFPKPRSQVWILVWILFYSQSCNIHYPVRWRIRNYINLNNICKVVRSQRVSLNADQESSPSHGLLPFHRQSCSTVAVGRAPFETKTLRDVGNGFQSWASTSAAVYSWSIGTQTLRRHVLGLSTPLLHQGDVTDTFPSVNFCASCGRFWTYVLFFPFRRWVGILCFARVC